MLGGLQAPMWSSSLQISEGVEHQEKAGFASGERSPGWLVLPARFANQSFDTRPAELGKTAASGAPLVPTEAQ